MKLPVVVGVERVTEDVVRLVRVKRVGTLLLWMGMGPKSCVVGVRIRPASGRPVPVRVSGDGEPEVEVRVRVALCEPVMEGANCTPSQQLVHGPVRVLGKVDTGGSPWP